MTEDQSVQGRRRIYYDPVGNETLIASDSEEEEPEEEEPKHDFSKGEDFIIWYVSSSYHSIHSWMDPVFCRAPVHGSALDDGSHVNSLLSMYTCRC